MAEVVALLARFKLSQYAAAFYREGYDNLGFLLRMADNEAALEMLAANVGFKVGHKAKFKALLQAEAAAGQG